MSKIFIFSNSFVAHTIINGFDKLFNIEFEEFILLRENHEYSDFKNYTNKKIALIESLEKCIELCDCIFVLKTKYIPAKSILYIERLSEHYGKKIYFLDLSNDEYHYDLETYISKYKFGEVPVILNIALGVTSQFHTLELILNRIFAENTIPFKQFFSQSMYNYITKLYDYSILKEDISKQLVTHKEYSVLIITINIGNDLYNLRDYSDFARKIQPDYIILQTDSKSISYINAHTAVNLFLGLPLDIIINSCYCNLYDKKFIVRCNNEIIDKKQKNLESTSIKEILAFDIFSKIGLPEGIIDC